ncbi:nucleolar protein 10 [Biomphalaria glabrata]|uniref:Nucleolar protein 10-like n=1 Tax=Biomphalaria glabrata TaxID=6526 RepID=A0A2C9JH54_BIOGL|nr:nucleolar protein 10-like [Biomphalaria glabrata]KAI8749949.1 nucleolar protein 10-like [Biomphalaria glabrata]
MQVSHANNVKIYNLSAGKALPEWLTDRQKRKLQHKDDDVRRRLELIQDFEMPCVSNCVKVSPDEQFICASGTYKPRFRCYSVHELCLKFEHGLDSNVVNFQFLSEDYSKVCFLQDDRFVEFHSQFGRLFRMRLPKYGRDLAYYPPSCDMYFVGVSPEINRINLEKGRFMKPLVSTATEINCCEFNPVNYLFGCGTKLGHLDCWDPRSRGNVGTLDIATSNFVQDFNIQEIPEITAMKFRNDGLTVALGTSTGHILLYDLRAQKPFHVKDHNYELPIKSIEFEDSQNLVLSMDSKILKLWNRNTGKHLTAIEPGVNLNQLCLVPNSGLLFLANEAPKILTYFIPALGPAPKWCSSLDSMTEELEEKTESSVYDDYKFVTRTELEELGLEHLIGTNLLRSVMHGFFIDIRLYHKAKAMSDPFAYNNYRKSKVREKIEQERANRVQLKKLPVVNKELAQKLMEEDEAQKANPRKRVNKAVSSILKDDRFAAMFNNPDFQIDPESEEYRLINPVMSKLDKARRKREEKYALAKQFKPVEGEDELEGRPSDEEGSSSSEDEHTWAEEVRKEHRKVTQERKMKEQMLQREEKRKMRLFELKDGEELGVKSDVNKKKEAKKSLAERLEATDKPLAGGSIGNKEITFSLKKEKKGNKLVEERNLHHSERRKLKRAAGTLLEKPKNKFWMGKKI